MRVAYLDSSAFVKTVVREAESDRLAGWLEDWPRRSSCELLRTEAVRAVRKHGEAAIERARSEFGSVDLARIDRTLLESAADLPVDVRSLDAIHLAAAQAIGPDLGVLVTYDERMARAAAELGIEVVSP